MDIQKTGQLIRELRMEKGMKQKELADRIHVSAAAVSKWETGHGFPDISVLSDLCRVLDITIEECITGERNTMTDTQNTVMNDVIAIAGQQDQKQKHIIRILSILLGLALLAGILTGIISIMKNRQVYIPYKAGSAMETNMYIENNGNIPTLNYTGRPFERLETHILMEPDRTMYLIISLGSNAWNESFGTRISGQYAFPDFNSDPTAHYTTTYDLYDPEKFQGVWLYQGDLRELFSHYPNWTKVAVKSLLDHCTYIPYLQEL